MAQREERGRVGVGMIGAGFVSHIHARAYRELSGMGVEIAGVAGLPLDAAQKFAAEFGIPDAYDDYRRLLDRPDIDVIDLCVPNLLHERFAVEAAQAGKHVIVEKPLTGYFGGPGACETVGHTPKGLMLRDAVASAQRMVDAARAAGVKLMYAENWLYAPTVCKANRLAAASGGTILDMRAQECHSGSHAAYAKRWREAGGGALLRLGAHPLGAMLYLKWEEGVRRTGKPIRVRAVMAEVGDLTTIPSFQAEPEKWMVTGWEDVESWATAVLTFEDGSRGTLFASDICLGGMEDTLELFLSNARVRCDMEHSNLMQAYAPAAHIFEREYIAEKLETKGGWSYPSIDEEWLLGYRQEIRDFMEAVAFDREPVSGGELGLEVVKVIYAAYLSAEEGRRVEL